MPEPTAGARGAMASGRYGFAGGVAAGFEKSTVGGPCCAFAFAVKYFRSFAPVTFAVSTAGN